MICKYLLAFSLSLPLFNLASGQVTPQDQSTYNKPTQVLMPSPNAASLGKYGGINIGLASGMPNINIPLYKYSSANISVPLSLSYTTSGFKVNEIASRVGFGWSLNAGGVITRVVRNSVDELTRRLKPTWTNDEDAYNFVKLAGDDSGPTKTFDTQPDLFYFNFNGNTGSFILSDSLNPDGSVNYQPALLTYSNIKFDRAVPSNSAYVFRAITADGIQYLFKDGDFTTSSNAGMSSTNGCAFTYDQYVPTAWYLSQIIHPNHDTINLSYSRVQFTYLSGASQAMYQVDNSLPISYTAVDVGTGPITLSAPLLSNTLCVTQLQTQAAVLDSIWSSSGGKIVFSYTNRNDVGDKLLASIAVYSPDSSSAFKEFDLSYTYPNVGSYDGPLGTTSGLRPFLMSVDEKDPLSTLHRKHSFLYNNSTGLPPLLSYAQDHWGYFNGQPNSSYLPKPVDPLYRSKLPAAIANRNPDPSFAQMGLLSSITYPTGGKDSLIYEGNIASASVTVYAPDSTITLSGSTSGNFATYTSGNIHIPFDQVVHVAGHRNHADVQDSALSYTSMRIDSVGATTTTVFYKVLDQGNVYDDYEDLYLKAGTYYMQMVIGLNNPNGSFSMTISPENPTQSIQNVNYGGVRMAKTLTYDDTGAPPTIKKYNYSVSGLSIFPTYEKHLSVTQLFHDVNSNAPCDEIAPFYYFNSTSTPIENIFLTSSSPATYSDVVESFGDNFENGGVEHQFTVVGNTSASLIKGDPIPGASYADNSYLNGREIYQKTFKMQGGTQIPVRETYTHYGSGNANPFNFPAYVVHEKYELSCAYAPSGNTNFLEWNGFDVSSYPVRNNWLYPDSIRTLTYDQNGINYSEQDEKIEYADALNGLPTKSTTWLSDRRAETIINSYPTDTVLTGNAELARQSLVSSHIVNPVLVKQIYKGGAFVTKTQNDFNNFSNGLVLSQTLSAQQGSFAQEKRLEYYSYDTRGKLLEQGKENDERLSYVWDYHNMYPVAEVRNASNGSFAYTSFDADGTGGWTVGSPLRNSYGIGGKKSYNLLNGPCAFNGLSIAGSYIVSYWSKAASPSSYTVSGSTSLKQGKTINGWTYFEHIVTTVSSITVSGSGDIDELRLYPANAQMVTFTYQPSIGISSQCDVGNVFTYYEYDGLGRLMDIKDQDGNVIKTIDYHYKGQ